MTKKISDSRNTGLWFHLMNRGLWAILCLTAVPAAWAQPMFTAEGVTNAAGYQNEGVSPGEVIVIFGSGLGPSELVTLEVSAGRVTTVLGGVRVLFDGVPAPLIYVSETQVSAIVPYAVFPGGSTDITVEVNGQNSAVVTVPTLAAVPAIFTADSSGMGQGAILNQDLSVNSESNPADFGDVIVIYGTGEGFTDPVGQDGLVAAGPVYPAPVAPMSVRINGENAPIGYVGAAPELVAGVFQINATVPSWQQPGTLFPIYVYSREVSSQNGVRVAVTSLPEALPPGGSEPLMGLTDNVLWRAQVDRDELIPFEVRDNEGGLVLSGVLQDRVSIRFANSTAHFQPMLRDLDDHGSGAVITAMQRSGFAGQDIEIEYYADFERGAIATATRSADGDVIELQFADPGVVPPQRSVFPAIFTKSTDWELGGTTTIHVRLPNGMVRSGVIENTASPRP